MRSSLQPAIEAAETAGSVAALAVVLVDLPGLTPDAVQLVLRAWRPGRIAVGADEGARAFQRTRTELVDRIPIEGDGTDLDTPADLERWRASTGM